MKSVLIPQPMEVLVREIEKPIPKEGEALLKVLYTGICGSDLYTYRGTAIYTSYPRIPGHEFSAEIVEIDENNDYGLKKGMIVTGNPYYNCGTCYSCQRGHVNCCMDNQTLGVQRDGIMSEYMTMPLERIYNGNGLSADKLVLVEPFCIGYHAAKRAKIQPGDKVLIIGAGTIGCMAMCSAKIFGAEVYMCDIAQAKLLKAMSLGADGYIVNDAQFMDNVNQITNGNGFDVCIEAAGVGAAFKNCLEAAAFSARVCEVGIPKGEIAIPPSIIQKKELNIMGSRNAMKDDFFELIDIVKSGKIDVLQFITNLYQVDDAVEAFQDFHQHLDTNLKVMIQF